MATAGSDGRVRIWDLRTYKMLHGYQFTTTVRGYRISGQALYPMCDYDDVLTCADLFTGHQSAGFAGRWMRLRGTNMEGWNFTEGKQVEEIEICDLL